MPHPLEQRVDTVRRKAAWSLRCIAACRVIAVLVGTLLVLGALDYFLRSPEPLLRWFFSLLVVAALTWAVWRWGTPALRNGFGRVATARRIEQHFPVLKDRLSNSIAFASESERDTTAGSPELRRAVIAETDALAVHLNFTEAIDRRPVRRAGMLAAVALVAVALAGVLYPLSSKTAVSRLIMPWADIHWPLRHKLAFVDAPETLAMGADFEAQVVDSNGRLPENVRLMLRFEGPGGQRQQAIEMKPVGGRMVHRLENITQPFSYRAIGGDDHTMPWTYVDVIEPPRLTDFTLEVHPPPYSGWPAEKLERVARVLAGSRLSVSGHLDKPATTVRLRPDAPGASERTARLAPDGRSFRLPAESAEPWIADKSGVYTFEVLDENGIAGGGDTRIDLQVVADSPPAIAWETPTDQTFVTPQAIVPIKGLVKDDLALQKVVLKYLRPDATADAEQVVELFTAPAAANNAARGNKTRRGDGESLRINTGWDLATLGLQPGNVLAVRLEASDFKPQMATTPVRRISIVEAEELENRLLQQQTSVFSQLAEALRLQQESHAQITSLQIQFDESRTVRPRDIDQLQAAELMQRQVQRLLSDPTDGVDARLAALLDELANNRIESQNLIRRLTDLQSQVRQVNQQWLGGIAQNLISALKTAREIGAEEVDSLAEAEWTALARPLATAEEQQRQVIELLEALLGELSEWDNFSRLAREIGQIRQQQQKTQQETESLRWKIAAAADEQPTAEQRAAARQLAARQQELARRFDKLQGRMDELQDRLATSDPQTARTLDEGNELVRRLAIGGQMRQAGRELTEYRVGASQQSQEAVLKSLSELLDALSSRRDRELLRTVESLRAARSELDQLRAEQRQLADLARQAMEQRQEDERKRQLLRLTREQEKTAKKADELRRKLERLQAKRPAESAEAGAQSMARAGEAAATGNAGEAEEQTREASRLLDEARQRLQAEIEQAQADLVREQLTRLEQTLTGLTLRQKNVIAEIDRLEVVRMAEGKLTEAQQASVSGIAAEQELLVGEVSGLSAKLTEAAAFSLALTGVEREMRSAAAMLRQGTTSTEARQPAVAALNRLQQILSALKQENESSAGDTEAPDDSGGGTGEQQEGESLVRSLAELRLMAELQAEINRRTAEIETARSTTDELTPAQAKDLDALAAEQGKLAEMVLELAQASKPKESEPEIPLDDAQPADGARPKSSEPASLDEQLLRDLMEKP